MGKAFIAVTQAPCSPPSVTPHRGQPAAPSKRCKTSSPAREERRPRWLSRGPLSPCAAREAPAEPRAHRSAQPPRLPLRLQQGENVAFPHRPLHVADDGAAGVVHELHTHLRAQSASARPGRAAPAQAQARPLTCVHCPWEPVRPSTLVTCGDRAGDQHTEGQEDTGGPRTARLTLASLMGCTRLVSMAAAGAARGGPAHRAALYSAAKSRETPRAPGVPPLARPPAVLQSGQDGDGHSAHPALPQLPGGGKSGTGRCAPRGPLSSTEPAPQLSGPRGETLWPCLAAEPPGQAGAALHRDLQEVPAGRAGPGAGRSGRG